MQRPRGGGLGKEPHLAVRLRKSEQEVRSDVVREGAEANTGLRKCGKRPQKIKWLLCGVN